MANQVYANNASAVLASSITDSSTTITVSSGQGAFFPTISGGNWAYITLVDTSGNSEIVKCTAHTVASDSFTCTRAQESTTARSFSAGDLFELRVTKATLDELRDVAHQTSGTIDGVVVGGTTPAAGTFTTLTSTGNATIGDALIVFKTAGVQKGYIGPSGSAMRIDAQPGGTIELAYNGAAVGTVSSTGLAIGSGYTLTAAGNIVAGNGGSSKFIGLADDGQYMRLHGSNAINQGGGIVLFGGASAVPNVGRLVSQAATVLEWNGAGNVGIGHGNLSAWSGGASKALQVGQFGIKQTDGTGATALASGAYYDGTNWIYATTGGTVSMYEQYGWTHRWSAAISGTAGNTITWAVMGYTHSTDTTSGFSATAAALKLYKDTATSRSINAAGTINASGADYAEYERKRAGCGLIAKGQIVGRTADGLLTDRWSEAITYGVKTTNPNLVGGDTWGTEEAIGMTMPEPPRLPEIVHADEPGDRESEAWAEWDAARQDAEASAAQAYALAKIEYDGQMVVFEQRLEAARADVDRIAYAGRVPCNVTGAAPGDYIVAAEGEDDSIIGVAVAADAIDFATYRRAVGRVHRLLDDGRAEIAVMVH